MVRSCVGRVTSNVAERGVKKHEQTDCNITVITGCLPSHAKLIPQGKQLQNPHRLIMSEATQSNSFLYIPVCPNNIPR